MKHFTLIFVASMAVAGCSSPPSKHWHELEYGMTYEDIIRLVGKPYRKVSWDEAICGSVWVEGGDTYVWRHEEVILSAAFLEGALVTHSSSTVDHAEKKSVDGLPKS